MRWLHGGATCHVTVQVLSALVVAWLPSQLSGQASAAEPSKARESIQQSYREIDDAYARSDGAGMVTALADKVELDGGEGGIRRTATREQLRIAAQAQFHQNPGDHVQRRARTTIDGLHIDRDHATVAGTLFQEVYLRTANGTTADVQDRSGFVDEWVIADGTWKIVKERRTSFKRTSSGAPSPTDMAQLRAMRNLNAQLRGFNAANNRSYCMNANQNQQLDYGTRLERCSN